MQPNVIVAEAIGWRARFAWLGAALAATIALLVVTGLAREASRERAQLRQRASGSALIERSLRGHHCGAHRWAAQSKAERAEQRALREAERARHEAERARHEAEQAEQQALREAEQARHEAERASHRALRDAERAEQRALREAERAERRALREVERALREAE